MRECFKKLENMEVFIRKRGEWSILIETRRLVASFLGEKASDVPRFCRYVLF